MTHWVSSRGKGYGLHVMIGNNLWRQRRVDGRREGEGEHTGKMKYVGSEIKACLWKKEICTGYIKIIAPFPQSNICNKDKK